MDNETLIAGLFKSVSREFKGIEITESPYSQIYFKREENRLRDFRYITQQVIKILKGKTKETIESVQEFEYNFVSRIIYKLKSGRILIAIFDEGSSLKGLILQKDKRKKMTYLGNGQGNKNSIQLYWNLDERVPISNEKTI